MQSIQNPLFGGMPFMMGQMPQMQQMSSTDSSQNPSGMQLSMMGQFPMMQMAQNPQMSGNTGQSGMPVGYTMVMNPEQLRSMNPAQLQQIQQQMQMMMMSKSMMPNIMQMPKNDQNDSAKK